MTPPLSNLDRLSRCLTIGILLIAAVDTVDGFQRQIKSTKDSWLPATREKRTELDLGTSSSYLDGLTTTVTKRNGAEIQKYPVTKERKNENDSMFDWYKSWYPLMAVEYLDPSKPHQFKLLGMDLVVWNDSAEEDSFGPKKKKKGKVFGLFGKKDNQSSARLGSWRVFEDVCPHRRVPLSEGRVERDGTLLCSYHGWRFDGNGACVDVPQEADANKLERIRANPRSKCGSFPSKVINDVLWVWPDSSENAVLESELTPPPVMPLPSDIDGTVDESRLFYGIYNFRELPYGADYFLENVVDPSHVPVSHHNLIGDRYTDSKPLNLTVVERLNSRGFKVMSQSQTMKYPSFTNFTAPCSVAIDSMLDDEGSRQILELYISPSRPGFSNHVGRLVLVKSKTGELSSAFKKFNMPIPTWANHLLAARFLNQDALFLHAQERTFTHGGTYVTSVNQHDDEAISLNKDYKELVYTPTQADKGVVLFREWLRRKAGGRIPFQGDATVPTVNNEVVFDQWNFHSKNCKHCLDAHEGLRKGRLTTAIIAAMLAIWRPGGRISTTVSVLAFSMASMVMHKLIKAFHRVEFAHAANN